QPTLVGVARQHRGDDPRAAGLAIEGFAHLVQEVRQARGGEVLVTDLQRAGLPGSSDLLHQRGRATLEERQWTEANPHSPEHADQGVAIEILHGMYHLVERV